MTDSTSEEENSNEINGIENQIEQRGTGTKLNNDLNMTVPAASRNNNNVAAIKERNMELEAEVITLRSKLRWVQAFFLDWVMGSKNSKITTVDFWSMMREMIAGLVDPDEID
eukprot:scaffold364559_cov61-Attheya_sp.AAC.1